MKLIVNPHKIEIDKSPVNEREIDITKCEFEFADEITNDYVKEAYFTFNGTSYKEIIVNNQCAIPSEVLAKKGQVEIGVVAFLVENEEEIKRYNPSPAYFNTWLGSLKDNAENSEPITPSEMEQFEQALNDGLNEVANVDIDAEQLDNGMSVTITNRDGEDKTVYAYDGEQGETGATPNIQIGTVVTGDHSAVTRTGTNENPIFNFVLEKGDKGDTGNGIANVTKTATSGLTDTYTITFTDGNETTFEVTNGKGISNIAKTSTSGLEDTYTITYNDNTTSTFTINNGRGITSILKTSSLDNVDTYTITYNDNTTSTFTVTNSTVTNQEFEELKAEHEELVNTLPRVEGTGTSVTLDNTAQYKMNVALSGNTSQTTYTGKNLFDINGTKTNYRVLTTIENNKLTQQNRSDGGYCRSMWGINNLIIGEQYTLSCNYINNNSCSLRLDIYNSTNETLIISSNVVTNTSGQLVLTFTATETSHYLRFYSNTTNTANTYFVTFENIQLEKNSTVTSYEPYVGGVPSPNPLYPQPIKKVTGNNSITVFGKNLFGSHCNLLYKNTGTWTNDGTSVTGSTTSGGYALYDLGLLSDYVGKTLTFSFSNTPSTIYGLTAFVMCENDGSNRETVSGSTLGTNSSLTVTIPSGYTQTRLAIRLYLSNVSSSTFNNIQIEKNSTATSYEPYQSQTYPINLGSLEYCKIGDYSDSFLLTTGKNLFMSEYVYTPSQTKNANLAAGTYTFSMCDGNVFGANIYFKLYDSNDNIITTDGHLTSSRSLSFSTTSYAYYGAAGWSSITFTIDSGYKLNIGVLGADGTRRAMLVTGDTIVRDYEPYGSGTWYIEKNIGEVILDGTETGWKNDSQNKLCGLPINDILSITAPSITTAICDRFQATTLQNSRTDNIYFSQNSTDIWFNNQNLTLDNFKAWIGTNNTTVYYPLATPTYTQITDTTLVAQLNNLYTNISSYLGQTNITQTNADLPFVINASALYDLNNLISRVATLEVGV